MINSMTGYGEAQGEVNGITYTVEIRTVNNRYFKTSIKLPETAAFLEEDIEKLLRKNLSRGTISCVLRFKNVSEDALFCINEPALQSVIERLSKIGGASADIKCTVDMAQLLSLPGILSPVLPDEKSARQIRRKTLSITQEAIEKLKQMRAVEGDALAADLDGHCKTIKQYLEKIRDRCAAVMAEYTKRLKKRVNELLAEAKLKLDEETLAREVAIFADRSDVSEEIARLDSHLQQFAKSCQANGQVGRRLDFISQEMLREANTIASKSSDVKTTRWVVDIKCRIDRIKEQVQNIE